MQFPGYAWRKDVDKAVDTLVELYDIYAREMNILPSATPSHKASSSSSTASKIASMIFKKQKTSSPSVGASSASVIEDYFHFEHRVSTGHDILQWWRLHVDEYPVLARLAKDILAIPAFTIASESCFSAGRRVISKKRCRLAPQMVRALVYKKDLVRANQRTQEQYEISRFTV